MRTDKEYGELAVEGFRVAQQQFIYGCETGAEQEKARIIKYLLDRGVIRESMIGNPDNPLYVAVTTDGNEAVDLSFDRQAMKYGWKENNGS